MVLGCFPSLVLWLCTSHFFLLFLLAFFRSCLCASFSFRLYPVRVSAFDCASADSPCIRVGFSGDLCCFGVFITVLSSVSFHRFPYLSLLSPFLKFFARSLALGVTCHVCWRCCIYVCGLFVGCVGLLSRCVCVLGPSSSCLLYTSPSPRDQRGSRMPSSA